MTDTLAPTEQRYAPIVGVRLSNFMSIKSGYVEFDEDSNVIQIVGYNDSGKSVILRALNVVFNNAYASRQKAFIHTGERFFEIAVTFADGFMIRYGKHSSGSSVYEMFDADEELIYTNKLRDGVYEKITDVPQMIKDYLGMVSVGAQDQLLNYGTNTDKQLLVETTGAENYQALSVALKSDELSRAVKLANTDNNSLKGDINTRHSEYVGYSMQYNEVRGIDSRLVDGAAAFAELVRGGEERVGALEAALSEAESASAIPDVADLEAVETGRLGEVESALGLVAEVAGAPEVDELALVEVGALNEIDRTLREVMRLLEEVDSGDIIPDEIESLPTPLDPQRIAEIDRALAVVSQAEDLAQRIAEGKDTLNDLKSQSDQIASALRAEGRVINVCTNCGELNLVDVA